MKKKLRPLLKWTGGKFDEFGLFAAHIPAFDRYIEPFFGGGGVFFALQPQVPALINDKSTDLINFYLQITKPDFKKELLLYVDAWDELGSLSTFLWDVCATHFVKLIRKDGSADELQDHLTKHLNLFLKQDTVLANEVFIVNISLFKKMLLSSLINKAKRIKGIFVKEGRKFTKTELLAHFETGVRGGTYLFFRKLLNQHYRDLIYLDEAKAAANWYFVREFCYASMFRFNAKGEFNIPYGGIAYNKKKFRSKAQKIFTEEVGQLFKKASFSNDDFEIFLNNASLSTSDFIFLDPPYDSEFSEYDQSVFGQQDQERLATLLRSTPAKWMVVIKETPFIRDLYSHLGINILTFNKNYSYNVRGRNNRGVTHLIIKNY